MVLTPLREIKERKTIESTGYYGFTSEQVKFIKRKMLKVKVLENTVNNCLAMKGKIHTS